MSADVVLKMTTILKEMMIVQLCSKSEWTLAMNLIISKTKHIFVHTGLTLVPGCQNRKHMYGFGGGKTWG